MTTEYAATGYNSPTEATRACLLDWITAMGRNTLPEAIDYLQETGTDEAAKELVENEWTVPNCDTTDEIVDAFDDLLDESDDIIAEYIRHNGPIDGWREALKEQTIPPWALRSALERIAADFIETSTNNSGQTWLARKANVDPSTVRRWVAGSRALTGASARVVRQEIFDVIGDKLEA